MKRISQIQIKTLILFVYFHSCFFFCWGSVSPDPTFRHPDHDEDSRRTRNRSFLVPDHPSRAPRPRTSHPSAGAAPASDSLSAPSRPPGASPTSEGSSALAADLGGLAIGLGVLAGDPEAFASDAADPGGPRPGLDVLVEPEILHQIAQLEQLEQGRDQSASAAETRTSTPAAGSRQAPTAPPSWTSGSAGAAGGQDYAYYYHDTTQRQQDNYSSTTMSGGGEADLVTQFMAFSACGDRAVAEQYLEMGGYNIEQAVNMYIEHPPPPAGGGTGGTGIQGGAGGGRGGGAPGGGAAHHQSDADLARALQAEQEEQQVRAAIPAFDDQLIAPQRRPESAQERSKRQEKEREEERQRMVFAKEDVGQNGGKGGKSTSAASSNYLNNIFAPPDYSEEGSLDVARAKAIDSTNENGRFVLVNVQVAQHFHAHCLNRDVWNNEFIKNLVKVDFVFWQRDTKSADGEEFIRMYKLDPENDCPGIFMLDPRTGRKVKQWKATEWLPDETVRVAKDSRHERAQEILNRFTESREFRRFRQDWEAKKATAAEQNGNGAVHFDGTTGATGAISTTFLGVGGGSASSASSGSAPASSSAPGGSAEPARKKPRGEESDENSNVAMGGTSSPGSGEAGGTTRHGADPPKKVVPPLPAAPDEAAHEPGAIVKVSFRLPEGGKRAGPFKVLKTDPMSTLLQAAAHYSELEEADIDVFTGIPPPQSLRHQIGLEKTVAEAGVGGQLLNVRKLG